MRIGRGINFVRSVSQAVDYREDHRGIPLRIVIFMSIARASAFFLLALPSLILASYINGTLGFVVYFVSSVYYGISTNNRLDFFTPFGFWMLKWAIIRRR